MKSVPLVFSLVYSPAHFCCRFWARVAAMRFVVDDTVEGDESPSSSRLTPTLPPRSGVGGGLISRLRGRSKRRGDKSRLVRGSRSHSLAEEEECAPTFKCVYDLLYEDGDAEVDVEASNIRDDRYTPAGVGPHRLMVPLSLVQKQSDAASSGGGSPRALGASRASSDIARLASRDSTEEGGGRSPVWDRWAYGELALRSHVGLENLGNTCFLNSVVQCLVHLPRFAGFFLSTSVRWRSGAVNPASNSKGEIAIAMRDLLRKMNAGGGAMSRLGRGDSSVAPSRLKHVVGQLRPQFRGCVCAVVCLGLHVHSLPALTLRVDPPLHTPTGTISTTLTSFCASFLMECTRI